MHSEQLSRWLDREVEQERNADLDRLLVDTAAIPGEVRRLVEAAIRFGQSKMAGDGYRQVYDREEAIAKRLARVEAFIRSHRPPQTTTAGVPDDLVDAIRAVLADNPDYRGRPGLGTNALRRRIKRHHPAVYEWHIATESWSHFNDHVLKSLADAGILRADPDVRSTAGPRWLLGGDAAPRTGTKGLTP
jgi:hypothetical protein